MNLSQPKQVDPISKQGIDFLSAYKTLIDAFVRVKTEQAQTQRENIVQVTQDKEKENASHGNQST